MKLTSKMILTLALTTLLLRLYSYGALSKVVLRKTPLKNHQVTD